MLSLKCLRRIHVDIQKVLANQPCRMLERVGLRLSYNEGTLGAAFEV